MREVIFVCGLAVGMLAQGALLGGCASTPGDKGADAADAQPWTAAHLPRATLPDATRAEIRALAMGAARSRAWTIAQSAEDRFVARRPLAPGAGVPAGAQVEVTSYFIDQAGDVMVVLGAELLTPAVGKTPAGRADYTETFRPALEQSLQSLRRTHAANRQRIARATPPAGTSGADPQSGAAALLDHVERVSVPTAPSVVPDAAPPPVSAPAVIAALPTAPAPVRTSPSPAPAPAPAPAPTPTPTTPVSWAYYAEQYARQNGCNVAPAGAILVEQRTDGEVHRIPCAGANGMLVICRQGTCRALL